MNTKDFENVVKQLVDAFLAWPLPESVCCDRCVIERGYPHRSGTNLLTATEARQMFEHLLAKFPTATQDFIHKRELVNTIKLLKDTGWTACAFGEEIARLESLINKEPQ